jgi:hypothetical protein
LNGQLSPGILDPYSLLGFFWSTYFKVNAYYDRDQDFSHLQIQINQNSYLPIGLTGKYNSVPKVTSVLAGPIDFLVLSTKTKINAILTEMAALIVVRRTGKGGIFDLTF